MNEGDKVAREKRVLVKNLWEETSGFELDFDLE